MLVVTNSNSNSSSSSSINIIVMLARSFRHVSRSHDKKRQCCVDRASTSVNGCQTHTLREKKSHTQTSESDFCSSGFILGESCGHCTDFEKSRNKDGVRNAICNSQAKGLTGPRQACKIQCTQHLMRLAALIRCCYSWSTWPA